MEEKIKNFIDNCGIAVLIAIVVTFNLIVDATYKPLHIFPICIFLGLCLLILFNKRLLLKEKLIKSKIDVLVTVFMLTLTLPLVFKTFCSYEETVNYILKYFFVYAVYLLTRSVVNTEKKVNILIATSVFSSLIIIALGLDIRFGLFGHSTDWLTKKLDIQLNYQPNRFAATFGYTNAVTIYLTFCNFLAVNRIENTKKKIVKVIYFLYIILSTYIIYISLSRVVLIVYFVSLFVYLFVKVYNKVKNIKKAKIGIGIAVLLLVITMIVYIIIGMKYSKPSTMSKSAFKFRKRFEPNKTYEIILDIELVGGEDESNNTVLKFYEVNKYFKNTVINTVKLEDTRQKYVVNIETSKDIYNLEMLLTNFGNRKAILHSCYIDGEEYIFSYKYIPKVIARLITSFDLQDYSIVKRGQYYDECIKIFKDGSRLIGNGGGTWTKMSRAYADYPFKVKETHSYFFELLICFGIIGVVAFLGLTIVFFIKILKDMIQNSEIRKFLTVFIGLMLVIIYSITFDFSMSFVVIILTVFEFMGILQFKNKEDISVKAFNYLDYFVVILLSIIFISFGRMCAAKYITKDNSVRRKIAPWMYEYSYKYIRRAGSDDIDAIKKFIVDEPYTEQNEVYRVYWDAIFENSENMSNEEFVDNIRFGVDTWENIKVFSQMSFSTVIERARIMSDVYNKLELYDNSDIQAERERLRKQIIKEYDINSQNIKDTNRNYITEAQSEQILDIYIEILKLVNIEIN